MKRPGRTTMKCSSRYAVLLALIVLLVPGAPAGLSLGGFAQASEKRAALRQKFEVFAEGWMAKLRERERFNVTRIEWRRSSSGVEGTYVGYDTANYRVLPLSNVEEVPIGKLVYLELKFRLVGDDEDGARGAKPQLVERVEVTELFRYHRGKWVY